MSETRLFHACVMYRTNQGVLNYWDGALDVKGGALGDAEGYRELKDVIGRKLPIPQPGSSLVLLSLTRIDWRPL